jgi:hypothetical protein
VSAYISFLTPMIDAASLLRALEDMGLTRGSIVVKDDTICVSSQGREHTFRRTPTGFLVQGTMVDRAWVARVHESYIRHEERRAREDKRAIEEARLGVVEAQRAQIHAKARKLGYAVEESREGGAIRMVLVRRSY